MGITIDTSTEFGGRVSRRLQEDRVVWLTTVDPQGTPQPAPVWFLWTGTDLLIASQPERPKLRNVTANPRAAVNLNATRGGGDVVVLVGDAAVDRFTPEELAEYDAKYGDDMAGLGMTPEQFHADYSVPVRLTPTRLRGL